MDTTETIDTTEAIARAWAAIAEADRALQAPRPTPGHWLPLDPNAPAREMPADQVLAQLERSAC